MSRNEQLLETIINGENLEDFKPLSRNEQILFNCVNKKGLEGLSAPLSRSEALLQGLSNMINNGLGGSGGASLNVAYGTTPPSDKTKIWLQCAEPSGVEVQNYLGECAVSNVANYGEISNPTTSTTLFRTTYYSSCYIGDNKIAIVGYYRIRIYDLISKKYISEYNCSGDSSYNYTTIYKDNILYYTCKHALYSFNLKTLENKKLVAGTTGSSFANDYYYYIFFSSNNKIDLLGYNTNGSGRCYHYRYDLLNNTLNSISFSYKNISYGMYFAYWDGSTVKINGNIYNFYLDNSSNKYCWKYNLSSNIVTCFTSFYNFMTELGWTTYSKARAVYDGERYAYLIGGYGNYNGTNIYSDLIIKYDSVKDSFELIDKKLISAKINLFSELVDNRIYIFGGDTWTSNNVTYGRPNQIDYFDISYPLIENNVLITTNTTKDDNVLPLINTETLKLNSNISGSYKGDSNNLAQKVNTYYYDNTKWSGINANDPFEWKNIDDLTIYLGETKEIVVPYTNNLEWSMMYRAVSDLIVTNTDNVLTINGGDTTGDFNVTIKAISSEYNSTYEKSFIFDVKNAIEWAIINDQALVTNSNTEIDLSSYYTNNSSGEVALSVTALENASNFNLSISENKLTITPTSYDIGTVIQITATVYGIDYTTSFKVTSNSAIDWTTIPDTTVESGSSKTIDLSIYYTNNTYYEVSLSVRESGDASRFSLILSGNELTISPITIGVTSTIYVTATVNDLSYTTSFSVTSTTKTETE